MRKYVGFITKHFATSSTTPVTIRGMGIAITKMTSIVEIIRHTVRGLYSITHIESVVMEDIYEPLEEGLDRLVFRRIVP